MSNADDRSRFWALYLTRFAEGLGFITLVTLLPTYINTLDPQATTVLGLTVGAGFIIKMHTTGFTLAQTAAIVPLAWEPLVERSTEMNDTSNLFSSGELTVLGISGQGMAFVSSYGSMCEVDVTPGEPLTVDEDYLVAWAEGLSMSRQRDGSIKSTMLGGERCVTEFSGDGHV